ncbi:MAG: PDZ domain-containing protein [Myxococcota bacterium]
MAMRVAVVLSLLSLAGCSPYDDLPLFELSAVEPDQIEPGGAFRIDGEGFPLGLTPTVRLDGVLYRPDAPPLPFHADLTAEVANESRVHCPVPDEIVEALGGRGTFDGQLRLAFRAANGRRDVFAERNVVVDFLPDTTLMLRPNDEGGDVEGEIDADHFGVALSREESGSAGVLVEAVVPGSPAALQGLRPGDTVLGLDGLRLHSHRDFLPDPTRTESHVSVSRKGLAGVHALRWPHDAEVPQRTLVTLIAALALGLLLGWRSPMLLCLGSASRTPTAVWLTRFSLLLVFAAALAAGPFDSTTSWITGLGVVAVLQAIVARRRSVAVGYAFSLAATLTLMLVGRSASLGALVEMQHGSVFDWFAFRTPASTLAFCVYFHTLTRLASETRLASNLYAAVAAVLGAGLFLGGGAGAPPIESIVLVFAKATSLMVIARWVTVPPKLALGTLAAGASLALAGWAVGATPWLPHWGPLAAGCMLALLLRAAVPPLRRPSVPSIA